MSAVAALSREQDSYGHHLSFSPSICIFNILYNFFLTVPGKGSPCRIITALPMFKAVAWSDMVYVGTCFDTWYPCLLWRRLQSLADGCCWHLLCFLPPSSRCLDTFNKFFFNIFYKSVNFVLLHARWDCFFIFPSISPIQYHHQAEGLCQGLAVGSSGCFCHDREEGFIFTNRISCFWVASRKTVPEVLHSRSWRSKSHLSTQTKSQEAGIFHDLVRSFLTKANILPLASDQNKQKILSDVQLGFKSEKNCSCKWRRTDTLIWWLFGDLVHQKPKLKALTFPNTHRKRYIQGVRLLDVKMPTSFT